jgi:hypothetical protein
MAQIGYDHKDSGESFYIKFPFKKYPQLLSLITKQEIKDKPLIFHFNQTKSLYSLKYSMKFHNIFSYRLAENNSENLLQLLNFDLQLSTETKMIKLINFDVSPIVRICFNNISTNLPFTCAFKFGKYQASRIQKFESRDVEAVDFSKLVKSMLLHYRTGLSVSYSKDFSGNLLGVLFENSSKIKICLNKIHNYEDNLKLVTSLKTYFDIFKEFNYLFKLRLSNDFTIKKSFIRPDTNIYGNNRYLNENKNINPSRSTLYKEHHVLSGYDCHSKLLEISLLNTENSIDNGCDFIVQNVCTVRLKEIPIFKNNEVLSRLNPYFSLETLFLPNQIKLGNEFHFVRDYKKTFRYVYTAGLSLALNDYMHIDFAFYSGASHNVKIKNELLNRFRININI